MFCLSLFEVIDSLSGLLCSQTSASGVGDALGEPVEAFVKTVSSYGAGRLDEPGAAADGVETKLVGDFRAGKCAWEILLVSEYKQHGVTKFLLSEHLVELLAILLNSLSIVRVDDIDETLGVSVVVSPKKSDLVLTADIPHVEGDVFVLDSLDVEADCGDGHSGDLSYSLND